MDGKENQKWMTLLRDYMIKHHINHTFWCLNTNSGDTGGLWDGLQFSAGSGTDIKWNEPKYELFEEALWQTASSGKYIGLDHQIALGKNGLSLNEYYSKYASTEGSNLDGGKKSDGKPVDAEPSKPAETTTTKKVEETTTTTTTTSTEKKEETTTTTTTVKPETQTTEENTTKKEETTTSTVYTTTVSNSDKPTNSASLVGDANLDEKVTVADAVTILQAIANKDKYALKPQGAINADCYKPGDGVTAKDALAIQMLDAKLITSLPLNE
jgi:hypothetical protein